MKNNKHGFTLVEIIIVLLVLGILAAIAIPSMIGYVEEARKSEYYTTGHNVAQTASTYIEKEVIMNPESSYESIIKRIKLELSVGNKNKLEDIIPADIPNDYKLRSVDVCFDGKNTEYGWEIDETKTNHKITKISIMLAKYDPDKPLVVKDTVFIVVMPNDNTYVYDGDEAWDLLGTEKGPIFST